MQAPLEAVTSRVRTRRADEGEHSDPDRPTSFYRSIHLQIVVIIVGTGHLEVQAMNTYRYLHYETFYDRTVARITLDRPRTRNAQNRGLLVELDEAFLAAEADDTVRVVILAGAGPLFSSGHDMGSSEALAEREPGPDQHPTMRSNGATRVGAEQRMLQEWHYFFQNTQTLRDLRKITIAQRTRHHLRSGSDADVGLAI